MRHIISLIVIVTLFSCAQNDTKKNEPTSEQKNASVIKIDSSVTKPIQVDTPKAVSTPISTQTKEQQWDEFWTNFSAAVNKKDKNAMIELSLKGSEFFDGGGGGTAAEWINTADDETWKYWQKAVKKGTKVFEKTQRITKNDYMIFDFKDGKWVWTAVMGD